MLLRVLRKSLRVFPRDRRGSVAVFTAVALPVLVGSLGLGAEVASWYSGKRALQNAADSAAIAAATNGTDDNYDDEAIAVAARYGLQNGVDGVTIETSNTAPCPGGGNECYSVVISRPQPLLLAQVVGFKGDTTVDGSPAKLLAARAVAIQANGPREYCILSLATDGEKQALRTNGAPHADLSGCNVMSNTDAVCTGHDLNADVGDAHGENKGCGKQMNSNVPAVADPYAGLASNIPSKDCKGKYWDIPKNKKKDDVFPEENRAIGLMGDREFRPCGDAIVTGPVIIDKDQVWVIYDGNLDLNDNTIQTVGDAHLTIIFAGSNNSRGHTLVGRGTLDFAAPTSGPWAGVAIYQAPSLTGGVDINEAGNEPTWNISGLVYAPHASVTLSGAVSKASNGHACFALVIDNLTINGTGNITNHGECPKQGLVLPFSEVPSRGQLVS